VGAIAGGGGAGGGGATFFAHAARNMMMPNANTSVLHFFAFIFIVTVIVCFT
jgi:hypothetical protein